jgi:TusA-related sulfurtransferase
VSERAAAQVRHLVDALARLDHGAAARGMVPTVRLRALLPGGPTEAQGPDAVATRMAGWFAGVDEVDALESSARPAGGRWVVTLRLRVRPHRSAATGGWAVVEQHAFVDAGDDGVELIDLLCSGFRAEPEPSAPRVHHFDAGQLGCADGLAAEFRRRIREIPVGDVLEVVARDPAAREDLPSLARLMGHAVLSVEAPEEGCLVFTMERAR